jgi:hypothetical protein
MFILLDETFLIDSSSGVVGADDESEGSIASLRLLAKILSDLTDLEDNTGSDLHEIPQYVNRATVNRK